MAEAVANGSQPRPGDQRSHPDGWGRSVCPRPVPASSYFFTAWHRCGRSREKPQRAWSVGSPLERPQRSQPPGAVLLAWLYRLSAFSTSKRHISSDLLSHVDSSDPVFSESRARVLAAASVAPRHCTTTHEVRDDITLEQILDMIVAIATIYGDTRYVEPIHPTSLDDRAPPDVEPGQDSRGQRSAHPEEALAARASVRRQCRQPMTTVLVVDDEANLVDLVKGYLEREGYVVATASDGPTAVDTARALGPDLVVLDLMLPGFDGLEVCRRLRQFTDAYVLMLTARGDEIDRIVGLEVGADDYLTKPFSPRELVARVKAMLRRPRGSGSSAAEPDSRPVLSFGGLTIDEARHEVLIQGAPVSLTPREFTLLATLAGQPGRVFTRAQLLEQVWGAEYYDDHVVDVHIANLRHKLGDDPGHPTVVETVRGVGYRFATQPASGIADV
jgi:two-component system, OmpR family, alkaline phosphatase synthesis response regulator PhoP